jgi:glycosyltransferase involved in cell wall biosynthesis
MMEGWGITTIEANACGTPVIASDVPGLRDSVNNPHTGFLVPYGDEKSLTEKILYLCEHHTTRKKFSRQAVDWSKKFDWNLSAYETLQLLS